jgi:hypothetical protein
LTLRLCTAAIAQESKKLFSTLNSRRVVTPEQKK